MWLIFCKGNIKDYDDLIYTNDVLSFSKVLFYQGNIKKH